MTMPMQMTGHDREYRPPRALRTKAAANDQPDALTARVAAGQVSPWDLFALENDTDAGSWAQATLDSLIAAIDADTDAALGCTECADTGFYGVAELGNPDLLTGLIKREGEGQYQSLQTSGVWQDWDPKTVPLEVLDLDLAGDLAAAITAGACGLLRRYAWPQAFLPPAAVVAATTVSSLISAEEGDTPHGEWVNYAVVDENDPGAVLDVVRVASGQAERLVDGDWVPDDDLLLDLTIPLVPLDDSLFRGLVADAPLTVSPNPKAEKLRRYWSAGRGAAKIKWGLPGDWKRCYRHLRKYMGLRAKGYCQNLHKRNTGMWTGSRFNASGERLFAPGLEESLLAAVRSGQWTTKEEGTDMDTDTLLHDGVYYEIDTTDEGLLRTVTAGGFPVQPPAEWFENPNLTGPTPLTITDEGRVYGHIATRDVAHIGYQGQRVIAPRSASGYAYFCTGEIVASGGKKFNVGQLTLSGGHAPLQATAEQAVKHYDDTNSGIADVAAGDDKYGVWVAGSLRSTVTPEQVRVIRASSPSGDWRPIGGNLEMVAVCHVNVPGFPTARVLRAGGAIQALVAAGARPLAVLRASLTAESSVLERLANLEAKIAAAPEMATIEDAIVEPAAEVDHEETPVPAESEPVVAQEVSEETAEVVPDTPEAVETTEPTPDAEAASVADALRAEINEIKAQALRDQVEAVTAAIPTTERKGGGYPIRDKASLANAIQAYGRAKPEDQAKTRAHIISAAKKLDLESMIPIKWRSDASK